MKTNPILMKAAIAGFIGAAALSAVPAYAAGDSEKGRCVGANSCKGKGSCKQVGQNDCAGKNGCKGKGFVEKTKAECEKIAKKDPKVHFETTSGSTM